MTQTTKTLTPPPAKLEPPPVAATPSSAVAREQLSVAVLTGGRDRHYAFGLIMALASLGIRLEVLGSDEVDSPEMHSTPNIRFLNLWGSQAPSAGLPQKLAKIAGYYLDVLRYALTARPKIFHILWNGKLEHFDRTLLMSFFKLCGRRIALTVHNTNAGKRDANDSWLNRLTLRIQYTLCDALFVHTEKMKSELISEFSVSAARIAVIPYGINNAVPDTSLTSAEARRSLSIDDDQRVLLFFGAIRPYKGLEYLVDALGRLLKSAKNYRLLIAGEPKKEVRSYLEEIQRTIERDFPPGVVIQKIENIPDDEMEIYFKAADVLVLPYTEIFQSGVLFVGQSFGLPVIASDVGSLREDLVEGENGYLCKPRDAADLAARLETYFNSSLFRELSVRRAQIQMQARKKHSWQIVGELSRDVYAGLLG